MTAGLGGAAGTKSNFGDVGFTPNSEVKGVFMGDVLSI
jgi:hypothetical protein